MMDREKKLLRVVWLRHNDFPFWAIAREFGVTTATVRRWYREAGGRQRWLDWMAAKEFDRPAAEPSA